MNFIYYSNVLKDSKKSESFRKDFLNSIIPFIPNNMLRLNYLITDSKKVVILQFILEQFRVVSHTYD